MERVAARSAPLAENNFGSDPWFGSNHQTATFSGLPKSSNSAPARAWSGFIQKARTAPTKRNTMLPINGSSQLTVLSMTNPNTRGEMIAPNAVPEFMRPRAKPANLGAMSMGMAHMGPIVNSEKKNARLKKMAAAERLCTNNNGNMEVSEQRNPTTTTVRPS